MSLEDLAVIASLVSSLAVVATLLFLLLQMRQVGRNQKSLMQQGRSARYVEIISARTQPYLAECFSLIMNNAPLDESQRIAATAHIDAYFWHFEDCHMQFEAGTIDRAAWESDTATLRWLIATPAFRAQWRLVRDLSNGRYRDYVDSLLRQVPVSTPHDLASRWRAMLAEELAAAPQSPPSQG